MSAKILAIVVIVALCVPIFLFLVFREIGSTPSTTQKSTVDNLNRISCWTQSGPRMCADLPQRNLTAACILEKREGTDDGHCFYLSPQQCQGVCRLMDYETVTICTCCADGCNSPDKATYNY